MRTISGQAETVLFPYEEVFQRFAFAWRNGPPPSIEDYLPRDAEGRPAVHLELVHVMAA
jgi:hypothetical protein